MKQHAFFPGRKPQWLMRKLLAGALVLAAISILSSCEKKDTPAPAWEAEVEQLRQAIAPYQSLESAIAAGWDNEFTGYRTQMGYHYLKGSLLDDEFEVERPEVLMFAPDANGKLQFVGVEYAVPIPDMDNPPPAPEGFTGNQDEWAINTEFNVWTLHVWVGIDNPNGLFNPHNPVLP